MRAADSLRFNQDLPLRFAPSASALVGKPAEGSRKARFGSALAAVSPSALSNTEQKARQEAISEERQRIVKDMHDGLGAQLVGMLSVVRHQQQSPAELESEIQQALDILRATIDTLSQAGD